MDSPPNEATAAAPSGRISAFVRRYRRVLGEGSWVAGGTVISAVITLAGTRVVTQYVHPSLYGPVNLLINLVLLTRNMLCTPVTAAAIRFYPDAARSGGLGLLRDVVVGSLRLSSTTVALLVLLGGELYCRWKGVSYLVPLIAAVLVLCDVWRSLEMSLFSGARRQRPMAVITVLDALFRPTFIVLSVLLLGASITSVLGATATSSLTILLLIFVFVHPEAKKSAMAGDRAALRRAIYRYALPMLPGALLAWTIGVSDRYIIESISRNTEQVGIYVASYGLISQPFILAGFVVSQTVRPIYFNTVAAGDGARAMRMMLAWFGLIVVVCGAGLVLSITLRGWVVATFLAPQYRAAIGPLPWIAGGYLFFALEQVTEHYFLAYKRTGAVLLSQMIGAVTSVVFTIPLVRRFGMMGAAYACPCYFLAQAVTNIILMIHFERSRERQNVQANRN